jgi:hypothetical protein
LLNAVENAAIYYSMITQSVDAALVRVLLFDVQTTHKNEIDLQRMQIEQSWVRFVVAK